MRADGLRSELAENGDGDAVSSNGSTQWCFMTGGNGFVTRGKASLAGAGIGSGAGEDDSPATAALGAKTTDSTSQGFEELSAAGSMTRLDGEEKMGSLSVD